MKLGAFASGWNVLILEVNSIKTQWGNEIKLVFISYNDTWQFVTTLKTKFQKTTDKKANWTHHEKISTSLWYLQMNAELFEGENCRLTPFSDSGFAWNHGKMGKITRLENLPRFCAKIKVHVLSMGGGHLGDTGGVTEVCTWEAKGGRGRAIESHDFF